MLKTVESEKSVIFVVKILLSQIIKMFLDVFFLKNSFENMALYLVTNE
jgi:hypothetical protein